MPPRPLLFTPIILRQVSLKNRVVVAPMLQYSADRGFATDWHLMNAGRYAAGGAGLVILESTKVERRGCGTIGDLGIWDDAHIPGLRRVGDFIRAQGSVAGIQLGHSGRRARQQRPWEGGGPLERGEDIADWDEWEPIAPSALAAAEGDPLPRALSRAEIPAQIEAWGQAARRADAAGLEVLEIHAGHGSLIYQFISPMANRREDDYGGSEANRMRFAIEVVECVRAHWPSRKPLFVRLSVEDDAGWGSEQSVTLSRIIRDKGVDLIDCSSGGMSGRPVGGAATLTYGYQTPYAEMIRREADMMSMAGGLIIHADQAERILQDGHADLIALARELIYNPNWPMDAAQKLGADPDFSLVPPSQSYWLAKRAASATDITPSTYMPRLGAGD